MLGVKMHVFWRLNNALKKLNALPYILVFMDISALCFPMTLLQKLWLHFRLYSEIGISNLRVQNFYWNWRSDFLLVKADSPSKPRDGFPRWLPLVFRGKFKTMFYTSSVHNPLCCIPGNC